MFHQYEERLQLPYLEALEALKQGFKTLKGSSTLYPRSGCAATLEICPQSQRDMPKTSSSHSAVDCAPVTHVCLHWHAPLQREISALVQGMQQTHS